MNWLELEKQREHDITVKVMEELARTPTGRAVLIKFSKYHNSCEDGSSVPVHLQMTEDEAGFVQFLTEEIAKSFPPISLDSQ